MSLITLQTTGVGCKSGKSLSSTFLDSSGLFKTDHNRQSLSNASTVVVAGKVLVVIIVVDAVENEVEDGEGHAEAGSTVDVVIIPFLLQFEILKHFF